MEQIRYARWVYAQIVQGNFAYASTEFNILFDCAIVESGGKMEREEDEFCLELTYKWFREPKVALARKTGPRTYTYLTDLTENEKMNLRRAYERAQKIQRERMIKSEAADKRKRNALSWWP